MISENLIQQMKLQTCNLNKIIQEFLDLSEISAWRLDLKTDVLTMNKKLKELFELELKTESEYSMTYFMKTFVCSEDYERMIWEREQKKSFDIAIYYYRIVTAKNNIKNVMAKSWLMDNYRIGFIYELF